MNVQTVNLRIPAVRRYYATRAKQGFAMAVPGDLATWMKKLVYTGRPSSTSPRSNIYPREWRENPHIRLERCGARVRTVLGRGGFAVCVARSAGPVTSGIADSRYKVSRYKMPKRFLLDALPNPIRQVRSDWLRELEGAVA